MTSWTSREVTRDLLIQERRLTLQTEVRFMGKLNSEHGCGHPGIRQCRMPLWLR